MEVLQFQLFFLVLIRVISFLVISPLFSVQNVPSMIKIGFSLILSLLLYIAIPFEYMPNELSTITFFILTFRELILGLSLGFITHLIFIAIRMAGQMTDFQMGFSMATIYDPMTKNNITLYGRIYYWIGLILFFVINGHHTLIYALARTFNFAPLGTVTIADFNIYNITNIFSKSFITAVQIGIPIIMVVFLSDVILGIMARTVPQLNVFIIGLPMKVLIGLLAFLIILPGLVNLMIPVIESIPHLIDKLL